MGQMTKEQIGRLVDAIDALIIGRRHMAEGVSYWRGDDAKQALIEVIATHFAFKCERCKDTGRWEHTDMFENEHTDCDCPAGQALTQRRKDDWR